jgi:hypothetical protein
VVPASGRAFLAGADIKGRPALAGGMVPRGVPGTLVQPFLPCFVFRYVFSKKGQGTGGHGPARQPAFAAILVPGVVPDLAGGHRP